MCWCSEMLGDGKCSEGKEDEEEEVEEGDGSLCHPDDPLTYRAPCLNNDLQVISFKDEATCCSGLEMLFTFRGKTFECR